jgi:hypothetical protein
MPRPRSDTAQVTLTLPLEWLEHAETYAEQLSMPGVRLARAEILRMAVGYGLERVKVEAERAARKRR